MKQVIQVRNLSKKYRLGQLNAGSLKEELNSAWLRITRRQREHGHRTTSHQFVWALKDLSFDINEGDIMGFIGSNGAGKSTFFKILSGITRPTEGIITGRGKIASLLEVGTGFHGELSGRENIYLNGQILGMKKKEIDKKFEEIVDFSGVERFLDTPVKRYSSGMYVRLAFAVSANLESDILLVDEALAVGDASFQHKCLNKMRSISREEGRTVLFVSHNMQAIRSLCNKAIYLREGMLEQAGSPEKVIANYLKGQQIQFLNQQYDNAETAPGDGAIRIKRTTLVPGLQHGNNIITTTTPLKIEFEFWYLGTAAEAVAGIQLFAFSGECIFEVYSQQQNIKNGLVSGDCLVPGNFLNEGQYYISFVIAKNTMEKGFHFEACLSFAVELDSPETTFYDRRMGAVRPAFAVNLLQQ